MGELGEGDCPRGRWSTVAILSGCRAVKGHDIRLQTYLLYPGGASGLVFDKPVGGLHRGLQVDVQKRNIKKRKQINKDMIMNGGFPPCEYLCRWLCSTLREPFFCKNVPKRRKDDAQIFVGGYLFNPIVQASGNISNGDRAEQDNHLNPPRMVTPWQAKATGGQQISRCTFLLGTCRLRAPPTIVYHEGV